MGEREREREREKERGRRRGRRRRGREGRKDCGGGGEDRDMRFWRMMNTWIMRKS